jgi:L-iditol 2-dehydrogenase
LSVGFHAANQGGAHAGQTAVVFGSGCIGLVSMMALRAEGVNRIIAVDNMQKRLDKALELGATDIVNFGEKDTVEALDSLTGGRGCDLVIETSGAEAAAQEATRITRKGATIVMVGYGKTGMINLPMSLALDKELSFKTVFRYRHIYPMAIEAVASGRVNLKGVVTHTFEFSDIQNAMDRSVADKATIVKAVVKIC